MTLAAGSLGEVVEPARVQAGQLRSAVGTVLGPQRGCWVNMLETVKPTFTHNMTQHGSERRYRRLRAISGPLIIPDLPVYIRT